MSKQNKKNKKANNIGAAMHTISYLGQQYIKSDYEKPPTLQEIVEDQRKHIMLIPKSKEDQEYIEKLEQSVVKDIPNETLVQKCEEYFTRSQTYDLNLTREEISKIFDKKYSKDKNSSNFTDDEKLNLLCNCHNCDENFPLRNLKWVDVGIKSIPSYFEIESNSDLLSWCVENRANFDAVRNILGDEISQETFNTNNSKLIETIRNVKNDIDANTFSNLTKNDKYYGIRPMCAKYPICPSSWSCFDLNVKAVQYNLEDHKDGKYEY